MSEKVSNFQKARDMSLATISQVNDYLFISGFGPVTAQKLKELGITCVIDATNIPCKPREGVDYIKIAVDDSDRAQLQPFFDQAADKILEHKHKGKTLVHCAAGISRSAALCMVYLVKHENAPLKDAYYLIKEKRSIISPNTGFWRQMIDYEKQIRGENSVKMTKGTYRELPDIYLSPVKTVSKVASNAVSNL